MVLKFHNGVHDPKEKENMICTITKDMEPFYNRQTVFKLILRDFTWFSSVEI